MRCRSLQSSLSKGSFVDLDGLLGITATAPALAVIGIIGGVGHDDAGLPSLQQCCRLGSIALLAGGQTEGDRASQAAHSEMDFGAQAAARTSKSLIGGLIRNTHLRRPRADVPARWWSRGSTIQSPDRPPSPEYALPTRLAAELGRLAKPGADGILRIERAPTHAELANKIGSHRKAVTKQLRLLARQGVCGCDAG